MTMFLSALVLVSLITGGYGSCSSSQEVKDVIMLRSPGYPQQRIQHACRKYRVTYKSPPGTTLSFKCSDFSIQCRGQSNYLLVTGGKKECGRSFPKATTSDNVLKVEYTAKLNRAPTSSKRTVFMFKCKIEVIYPQPSFSSCDCTAQKPAKSTRIALGHYSEEGEFPHMVAILENDKLVCGGSLITEKWVVTSVVCDVSTKHQVRMGFVSLRGLSVHEEYRNVKSVTAHPGYDHKTHRYSVALVELDKPVAFNSFVRPICLPEDLVNEDFSHYRCVTAGWGINEDYEQPDLLKKVHLQIVGNKGCRDIITDELVHEETICTYATHGRDTCKYDEGGPLQYTKDNKVYLIGLVSFTEDICSHSQGGLMFTRISAHRILAWIRDTIGEHCDKPTQKPPMLPYSCDVCGKKMASLQHARIVGGTELFDGEFPYQVILATDSTLFCGGSLISHRWVLTAAHCRPSKYLDNVILGVFDRWDPRKLNSENRLIARVVNHPKFDEATYEYDVALVELQESVNFTDYIQPVCLPDGFTDETFAGKEGVVTGWGADKPGEEYFKRPNKVNLDILSNRECRDFNSDNIFPTSICTYTPLKDSCDGDFGGALVYEQDGRMYQIGVTSWGYGCGSPLFARVFSRVSHPSILKWIKKTAGIPCDAP